MQVADVFLILLLLASFLYGFCKGLFSIAAPVLSIVVSIVLRSEMSQFLTFYFKWHGDTLLFFIVSLLIIYVLTRILIAKFFDTIKGLLNLIFLGWVERTLGGLVALFGASFLIFLTFYILEEKFGVNTPWLDSYLISLLYYTFKHIFKSAIFII